MWVFVRGGWNGGRGWVESVGVMVEEEGVSGRVEWWKRVG